MRRFEGRSRGRTTGQLRFVRNSIRDGAYLDQPRPTLPCPDRPAAARALILADDATPIGPVARVWRFELPSRFPSHAWWRHPLRRAGSGLSVVVKGHGAHTRYQRNCQAMPSLRALAKTCMDAQSPASCKAAVAARG